MKPSKFLAGFVVAALILSGCKQENAPQSSAASPPQVFVAPVEQRDVPIMREWIGQLDGSENVDIRAQPLI
jgi:membrane fusion protein, multidrug efflux system